MDFEEHLEKNGYFFNSILRARSIVMQYNQWLHGQGLNAKTASYNDLMNYIGSHQEASSSKTKINEHLRNIRLYYDYLKIPNIAFGVVVKGHQMHQMPLFTEKELDELYSYFESRLTKGYWRYSDKILLGFIIYQGLDPGDIFRIELSDLDLPRGKVYIPEGQRRKASRDLQLEAHQIIPLHDYIARYRDRRASEKLLSPQCTGIIRLEGQLNNLLRQLKEQAIEIGMNLIRFSQIRQSRITIWVRQHGLRKAQYMAGFRRVHTAEKYRRQDPIDLSECIKKYHPLQ